MTPFATLPLPANPTVTAPDGSAVRVLLGLKGGGMAHFQLQPGQVAGAVIHRSVEEIWWVLDGRGEIWRRQDGREEVTVLVPGLCLTIPLGTAFQFRAAPDCALGIVAITLPPWPGADEAMMAEGPWPASQPSTAA